MGERILSFFLFLTFSSFPQTPLHEAARVGSVECVNALINHGADVAAKTVRSERVCVRVLHTEEEMCGDLCDLLTDACLGVGVCRAW